MQVKLSFSTQALNTIIRNINRWVNSIATGHGSPTVSMKHEKMKSRTRVTKFQPFCQLWSMVMQSQHAVDTVIDQCNCNHLSLERDLIQ
jgi:hypothetical protein